MDKIGLSAFALAIGLVAAPRAQAQSPRAIVCRDGEVAATARGGPPCAGRAGVDGRATAQARRSGGHSVNGVARGVYSGRVNGSTTGQRGVYSGGNDDNGRGRDHRRHHDHHDSAPSGH